MRAAKRVNPKTGNEEPLRKGGEILHDIQNRLYKRIRHGAPMITNEEIILIYEALEYIMDGDDGAFASPSDVETSGSKRSEGHLDPGEHSE